MASSSDEFGVLQETTELMNVPHGVSHGIPHGMHLQMWAGIDILIGRILGIINVVGAIRGRKHLL